jgi:PAS domain-containing protein
MLRDLADRLAMAIFIVDPAGVLLFQNAPAEKLLGLQFDPGPMPFEAWSIAFSPTDRDGVPIPADQLPLAIALREGRPAQGDLYIDGLDGARRMLTVTAIPLLGEYGGNLGAAAIFWEQE